MASRRKLQSHRSMSLYSRSRVQIKKGTEDVISFLFIYVDSFCKILYITIFLNLQLTLLVLFKINSNFAFVSL